MSKDIKTLNNKLSQSVRHKTYKKISNTFVFNQEYTAKQINVLVHKIWHPISCKASVANILCD